MSQPYHPPVAELLTLGSVDDHSDYARHGFQPEHVPELVRMATDPVLNHADTEGELWAPMHAWRVLGDLRAAEAAAPLVQFLGTLDDDYAGDLGLSIARIGAPAYPHLVALLRDTARSSGARAVAAEALAQLATIEPALRDECVAVLTDVVASEPEQEVVEMAADGLLDLKAAESAPAFRRALEDGRLNESDCGDWEDVQVELGLLEERITPRPPSLLEEMIFREYNENPEAGAGIRAPFGDPMLLADELSRMGHDRRDLQPRPRSRAETAALRSSSGGKRSGAAAAKRKMANASRKQNRRRK